MTLGKWKGNQAAGSTARGGVGRQKVQEVVMTMQLHSKKCCSVLICRGGPLLPPGFNFLLAFHHSLGMAAGEQVQGKHQCPACSPGFDFGCSGHTGFNFSPAFKKAKNFST